jgi:hypothetical protein
MTRYTGGTQVRSGYYVDARSLAFASVDRDGAALPGGPAARYVRVPTLAVMAAAPALGGLFVVALPLLGFGVGAYALARRLGLGARKGAQEVAATLATPAAAPGMAHLTGHPAKGAPGTDSHAPTADQGTEELAREIEEQRGVIH